jgi:DNA polymerase I-like protein with 3'-5' exonuclease and polymerase domains
MATAKRARLNCQGMARRDPGLMTCLVSDPGRVTVSIDLSAGEPTVVSHFSKDRNYVYACFDGVGKRPEYRGNVLMLDDIYLMTASVSPLHQHQVKEAFYATKWKGLSFQDQWLEDNEVIKKDLKVLRQFNKMGALGFSYGMGPKKFVKQAYDAGYIVDQKSAKGFYLSYWNLFSGVRRFADKLTKIVEHDGYLVNPFGYRLTPSPFKAFNAYIQSSVSGIMHVFTAKLMAAAPYAHYVTLIHDELLISVPEDKLEQFRHDKDLATQSLNDDLQWSVAVRTGFVAGRTWYEAK